MAATAGNAAAEAARLAIEMGSAAVDLVSFMACLGEELPVMNSALKTLKTIRVTVESLRSHREEVEALENRCTYMTACLIIKCRLNPSSTMVVTPLEDCMEEVENFTRRCSRRGKLSRVLKASSDKDEIAELNARLNRLTGDLGLSGIATLEGKIDGMTSILERMGKKQDAVMAHLERTAPKVAKVPRGTPTRKSWHVERHHVMDTVLEAFNREGGARLVGLVGRSGAGKTTAASESVRSTKVQEAFSDGMVWLSVNKFAKDRLPFLLLQLARTVYEDIAHSVGDPPSASEDGAAYIKQLLGRGRGGSELKCLLVADNVWEEEVVSKLLETGMWVLLTTRDERLVTGENGDAVGVDELPGSDAQSVLRKAAELPPEARLPDDAVDLIGLCGHVAMDLAFVGRWSIVRGRHDRTAWSEAARKVREEIGKIKGSSGTGAADDSHMKRRKAILQAGFADLAVGSDDERVQQLYLSLGVLPDGHAFTKKDAATLLYDKSPRAADVASAGGVLETLERWAVLRSEDGLYRMHEAHSGFARDNLEDRGDVRKRALKRWRASISSLEAMQSINAYVLKRLWLAVEDVGGEGWAQTRPYIKALDEMSESHPSLRETRNAVAWFYEAQEDWDGAIAMRRQLLEAEKRDLGHHHPFVLCTYRSLARCAERLGRADEETKWLQMERDGLPLALAKCHEQIAAGRINGLDDANALTSLASTMSDLTSGDLDGEEMLLRRSLAIKEAELGPKDVRVAVTLCRLGSWARRAGRLYEAETLLRRCLAIEESKLGPEKGQVTVTLHELACCFREAGRLDEAEVLWSRCLAIQEGTLGSEGLEVACTLRDLATCVRELGRLDQAEQLLRRSLAIQEDVFGHKDVKVVATLYRLGLWVQEKGRAVEAEGSLRRCLAILEARLGPEDVHVAYTLHGLGLCVRQAGRLDEAEALLRRCVAIKEAKLGRESMQVAYTLNRLAIVVRQAGLLDEAQVMLGRCLAIEEAELGSENNCVANTRYRLGSWFVETGLLDEGEELLRRSLAFDEAEVGPMCGRATSTLYWLGICLRGAGSFHEAEYVLRRCLVLEERRPAEELLNVAATLHELGVCTRGNARLEEAARLFRRCFEIVEAKLRLNSGQSTVASQGQQNKSAGLAEKLKQAKSLLTRYFAMEDAEHNLRNTDADTVLKDLGKCLLEAVRLS